MVQTFHKYMQRLIVSSTFNKYLIINKGEVIVVRPRKFK